MSQNLSHLSVRCSHEQILEQSRRFCLSPVLPPVLDAIPGYVLILNEYRQVIFANLPVVKLLDLQSREQVYGMRPGELLDCEHSHEGCFGCGSSNNCTLCGAAKAIRASEQGANGLAECYIHQRSHKRMLDLRAATTPIDIDGYRYTILALTDIAHEKRRRAIERIFFHDMLNTLGALGGYVQMLTDSTNGQLEELTSPIARLTEALTEEVCAQRDLEAAENNDLAIRHDKLNGREILEELAVNYRKHPASEGRTITIMPATENVTVQSDRRLLLRILSNMLKNALEATKAGHTITLRCDIAEDGNITFSVHNPGHMAPEIRMQVFHRAFSTKGSSRGLGTYSMKLLGEKYLGGKVWFTSTPDEGTTFFAGFPANHTKPQPATGSGYNI